ncbi:MAG: glycosyltransferase family 9 protein [Pseudomonadota bacterium]|nr:glycosyltransferase family 9 protein [Pseudomonadota bacterium]
MRQPIHRILVIRWGALGDLVITSAVFEDLARAFPQAEIHLNTEPPWDRMFADDPRFAKVIAIRIRGERRLPGTWRWLAAMRSGKYDLIIDLQSNDRSRLLLALFVLSGASVPYRAATRRHFPYNIVPPPIPRHAHALEYFRAPLRALGVPVATEKPALYVAARHEERAALLMQAEGLEPGGFAILMPGSNARGLLKRWGAARYAGLARLLHAAGMPRIALVGGAAEAEECAAIERHGGGGIVNLCGRTEILEIVPLSRQARFIVANDTGTAHLASATATPMVVICGPTDPRRVKPLGNNVVAIKADVECCQQKTCSHHACMAMITPAMVFARLMELDQACRQAK